MINIIDCIVTMAIINFIMLVIAVIILGMACFRNKDLIYWLPVYVSFTIGQFFYIFQFTYLIYQLLANLLFMFATLFIFVYVLKDYYKIYLKSRKIKSQITKTITATVIISPVVTTIQIFFICLLIIAGIILLHLYIKSRSTNYLLFMACAFMAGLTTLTQTIPYLEVEIALLISNIFATIYITIMLVNGVLAYIEFQLEKSNEMLKDTIKEKDYLKDRYSHDLGNILHAITMAYGIINMKHGSLMESDDLDTLIKDKINEASKLVKYIRNI